MGARRKWGGGGKGLLYIASPQQGFKALRQAGAPMAGLEPATDLKADSQATVPPRARHDLGLFGLRQARSSSIALYDMVITNDNRFFLWYTIGNSRFKPLKGPQGRTEGPNWPTYKYQGEKRMVYHSATKHHNKPRPTQGGETTGACTSEWLQHYTNVLAANSPRSARIVSHRRPQALVHPSGYNHYINVLAANSPRSARIVSRRRPQALVHPSGYNHYINILAANSPRSAQIVSPPDPTLKKRTKNSAVLRRITFGYKIKEENVEILH
ncbi:hypothetical protein PoB_005891100 [Plakobranchus ocellatus]|uniref:Uncharacterized protein n=1 Tax=Plakobranchus ocellatus TaxID=259542 RepID=A0AAV4CHT7_9GAST|nr:hypothetical protein PoB_005891100 [Plakobranchus ocellatus]